MSESSLVLGIQSLVLGQPVAEYAAVFCARALIFFYIAVYAWLWMSAPKEKHAAKEGFWTLGLAILLVQIIAFVVMRNRPYLDVHGVVALIPPPLTSAFPSGHTAAAVALVAPILYANRTLFWIAAVMAAFVALGRIAVGVHYPTDILGGIAAGIAAYAMVRWGHRTLRSRKDVGR